MNNLPSIIPDFPGESSNAWPNGSGMGCMMHENKLILINLNDSRYNSFNNIDIAVKTGNDYIFTQGGMTVIFKMTEGKLTSITIGGADTLGLDSGYNGTYAPVVHVVSVSLDII